MLSSWQLIDANHRLKYYHAPLADPATLEACKGKSLIFEIDVSLSSDPDFTYAEINKPYIGHPSQFYSMPDRHFPVGNVPIEEFKQWLLEPENQSIRVLLDIKNVEVLDYVVEFAKAVGPERCFAHSFIKDWEREPPVEMERQPHWIAENIPLAILDERLGKIGVPLFANCRSFNDEHVTKYGLLEDMVKDAKKYKSVAALGLYYRGANPPNPEFLKVLNQGGYRAWVNANVELSRYEGLEWVGMCDTMEETILDE